MAVIEDRDAEGDLWFDCRILESALWRRGKL